MRRRQLVPVLLALSLTLLYPLILHSLPLNVTQDCGGKGGPHITDRVGFCTRIGFDVSRPYYFGLLRLPVYRLGMNLHLLNQTFLPFFLLLGGGGYWLLERDERHRGAQGDSAEHGYSYSP